jgi:hypothetical protein
MMRRLLTILCCAALVVGVATSAAPVANAKSIPSVTKLLLDDEGIECLQLTPRERAIPALNKSNKNLRVAILRDRGVPAARAAALLAKARRSYTPLHINLVLARNDAVNFTGVQARDLIAQAKALYGGKRPAGVDVVAVMTSVNILNDTSDLQGLADCIGGVGLAHHAFLVVEDTAYQGYPDEGIALGPIVAYGQFPAKALAHEIGHLMGAHHHYGNCVQGIPTEPLELSPCTLMGPSADFISFNFSTLNGIIVRGHAEHFLHG